MSDNEQDIQALKNVISEHLLYSLGCMALRRRRFLRETFVMEPSAETAFPYVVDDDLDIEHRRDGGTYRMSIPCGTDTDSIEQSMMELRDVDFACSCVNLDWTLREVAVDGNECFELVVDVLNY